MVITKQLAAVPLPMSLEHLEAGHWHQYPMMGICAIVITQMWNKKISIGATGVRERFTLDAQMESSERPKGVVLMPMDRR